MLSFAWAFVIYAAVFPALVYVFARWHLKQRKTRPPFPEKIRLLRGPGESLQRRLTELDERLVHELLAAFVVPMVMFSGLLWISNHFTGVMQVIGVIAALLALLATMLAAAKFLVSRMQLSSDCQLGYFGERVVAEMLDPLKARGYRVFHDVPCEEGAARFNIDHVVVGPGGVFAIETKTRRKGRARGGYAEHEIIFDGSVLAYPWGEDRHGLDQAQRQAGWLADWLARALGQRPPVQPILTFPGWMIIRRGTGPVSVLNPREIPVAVESRRTEVLSSAQIDLIARQLDARCRDVAY